MVVMMTTSQAALATTRSGMASLLVLRCLPWRVASDSDRAGGGGVRYVPGGHGISIRELVKARDSSLLSSLKVESPRLSLLESFRTGSIRLNLENLWDAGEAGPRAGHSSAPEREPRNMQPRSTNGHACFVGDDSSAQSLPSLSPGSLGWLVDSCALGSILGQACLAVIFKACILVESRQMPRSSPFAFVSYRSLFAWFRFHFSIRVSSSAKHLCLP
ncbi:hypothetical protein VTK26DRAFT_4467 [Humicola hyalothermophila]